MDNTLKIFLAVCSAVGLGQMLLFWFTRRSKKVDSRDEKELSLESSFLAERRELLTTLRGQLAGEQTKVSALEREKVELLREQFRLQTLCNEVLVKYDFLRNLNPEAALPAIKLDPPATDCPPAAASIIPPLEGGHEQP